MTMRQPIVTVAGHIDHGKTTILDTVRGTSVASKEAGLITQKISSTAVPAELINKRCGKLLKKYKIDLEIPGFLFVDTPGHAAFTNLRKRGGALADIAVLVIDINEGIMEQTRESINVLKANKLPFIIALNKVDKITGWTKKSDDFAENLEKQASFTRNDFDKKFYNIVSGLVNFKFDSDLFFRINDFTKQIALVPCSGKTGEGISELLVMLTGLAQKFLKGRLTLEKEGKGTILEIKRERGFMTVDAILYDGTMNVKDSLIIASIEKPVETKIRALFEAMPLAKGFNSVQEVSASSGIKMHLATDEELIPGMPFIVAKTSNPDHIEKLKASLQKEVEQVLHVDKEGIIAKAESLGSLEALVYLLRKEGISVKRAEIGNIKRTDVVLASGDLETNPLNAVIAAFNVSIDPGIIINSEIKVMEGNIVYRIIEDIAKWRAEKTIEIEREKLSALRMPCRVKILPHTLFRRNNPAIFGVIVEGGTLKAGLSMMDENGEEIDKVRAMQSGGEKAEKAKAGEEVAISMPKITFGRQINENQIMYSIIDEDDFRKLKESKKYLSSDEISVLQEIANIKRKIKPTWGI